MAEHSQCGTKELNHNYENCLSSPTMLQSPRASPLVDRKVHTDQFNRRFWVQSNDKRFAYDVLHPRMMEFLLAQLGSAIDLEGGAMCVSDGNSRWEPEEFRAQLDFVRRFCDLWPRHLLVDLAT